MGMPNCTFFPKPCCSLVLDDNDLGFELDDRGMDGLTSLGQLEELNLSANRLGRLPPQVCLRGQEGWFQLLEC